MQLLQHFCWENSCVLFTLGNRCVSCCAIHATYVACQRDLPVNVQHTHIYIYIHEAFDSIHRGKMEQILLTYGLLKETVAAIMLLYWNTKVKVHSLDGDTDYFNIVAGVLQGDILAPYLFIICLDYLLRTSIDKIEENGFKVTKERSRR